MAKVDNMRIEKYSSVSTTVPVVIAEKNEERYKLKIRSEGASGHRIGLSKAMESDNSYFIPQNEEVEIEKFKGRIYALSVSTASDVCVFEESM